MDEDSAVYSFEATIEGKTIIADLQEKEQAHKTYNEAISQGKQAFLLEEDKSSADIFRCRVGNLPPGQEAEVTLKYVRELPMEADGAVRFVLPAVLNPRYTPKDHKVSITATRPQVSAGEITYTLSLNAHFQSAYGIAKIESNCNITPLEYTDSNKIHAKVSLAEGHKFDRDVEFLAYYTDVNKPSVIMEAGLGATGTAQKPGPAPPGSIMAESVAMLNFYPSFPAGQEQSECGEFIFLVDRSGSMDGPIHFEGNAPKRIQSAKDTLVLLLKSLPLGCYFNIYGFGSHFESFFPESVEYTQQSMAMALRQVSKMSPNFGGTEIIQPLKRIYNTAGRAEHPRQLFVFTDGEVGNTKQVINEVQKNAQNHRCFTFGIGEGASTSLIKGMARAGNGTFEFITGKERLQTKVLRTLKYSLQPPVKDISLTWTLPSGVEATILSKVPTCIFQGQRSIVYVQLKGKVENEAEGVVCLQYKLQNEIVMNDLRFPLDVQSLERPTIHRLAAKTLISELEHGLESPSEEVKKKILETSLQSGVVSSLTAYVAVNKDTNTRLEGPPVRRDVPAPGAPVMINCLSTCLGGSSAGLPDVPTRGIRHLSQIRHSAAPVMENRNRISQILKPKITKKPPLPAPMRTCKPGTRPNISEGREAGPESDEDCYVVMRSCIPGTRPNISEGREAGPESDEDCYEPQPHSLADRNKGLEKPPQSAARGVFPDLMRLIPLQNADGSWDLTPEISGVLGISETDIKARNPDQVRIGQSLEERIEKMKKILAGVNLEGSVWVTVLAVIWLHTNYLDQREEWELLERKAVSWVRAKAGSSLGEFVTAGNQLLKSSVDPEVFGL